MTVSLTAADGELPLAFEQYEHLSKGTAPAYVDAAGRPLFGDALNRALADEGVGMKDIQIRLAFAESGADDPTMTTLRTRTVGTLDADSLARLIHAESRNFTGSRRKGESPALMFIMGIDVGAPRQAPATAKRSRKRAPVVRQFVKVPNKKTGKLQSRAIYRDRKTGRFTSRAQWESR